MTCRVFFDDSIFALDLLTKRVGNQQFSHAHHQ